MSAYVHLNNVVVSPGYKEKPQVRFNEVSNGYGYARFKVSSSYRVKDDNGTWKNEYNNYTVEYKCKKDSRQLDMLGARKVRINIRGELREETFNDNKYLKVVADNVEITKFGENNESNRSPRPSVDNEDDVPF